MSASDNLVSARQADSQLTDVTDEHVVSLDDLLAEEPAAKPSSGVGGGVFVGTLKAIGENGNADVEVPGLHPLRARCTVRLSDSDVGKEVAVMFEQGDDTKPLLMGVIQSAIPTRPQASAVVDDDRLTLCADREIVLKCGKASITLTRAGKILLRGAYLSSRSSGVNRIKGGSVQIN